jgi:alpha-glucosidase
MKKLTGLLFILPAFVFAQQAKVLDIEKDEKWFGGAVNEAHKMPFENDYSINLYGDNKGNQTAPLFLSSTGRYIWSEEPFKFTIKDGKIILSKESGEIKTGRGGNSLAQAFNAVSHEFFPSTGVLPDTLLFSKPQYNTWIELLTNQNQADILKYAHAIISNEFPPGVLMIDDNWGNDYGDFRFKKEKFPDAKKMIDELHGMGFKVMLWISPFISPDSEIFRELRSKKFLLLDNNGDTTLSWEKADKPAIISWWNGYSALMDFTNPKAVDWFSEQLDQLVKNYGVDGFKFDAGDMEYYPSNIISHKKISPNEHTGLWGLFGLKYPLNEYRGMWKMGGQPLAERLRDKEHTWDDLRKLIPHITTAGLLGYQFTCPDMIGGGESSSFIGRDKLDEELVVRSAQCSALMPMMQFSVAPWRILSEKNLDAVKKAVDIRMHYTPYILEMAKASAKSGEPIVRNMEYMFPNQGYADVHNQFMLGTKYMIAPMLEKGNQRKILFPKGLWRDDDGKLIKGPAVKDVMVPIDRLPVFELVKK